MPFDISSQEEARKSTVEGLSGNDLQEEVRNQAKRLEELVLSSEFTQRGALLVVEGSWGAGKTTVTWALVNLLEKNLKEQGAQPVFIFKNQSSLLPFGSASESIRVFLTGLAHDLWEENFFDVRKDIQRSILEVAPPEDGQYNVSTHFGPVNVSKNIGQSIFVFQNSERIKAKFRSLAKKNGVVVLILDDIDRLRPNEIVSILRLAEQLRQIPRVLTIVPVYRTVADNAFVKDLELGPADAATFMRKFTDFELRVENNFQDLAACFKGCFPSKLFTEELPGAQFEELCWLMMLFNLVTQEAIQEIKANNGASLGEVFSPLRSKFLTNLKDTFVNSQNPSNNPSPVFNEIDMFVRLGSKSPFSDIAVQAHPQTVVGLEQLINNDNALLEKISTNQAIIEAFNGQPAVPYNKEQIEPDGQHQLFINQVIIPLIKGTEEEAYLTNNYRMRDVKKLAHSMQQSRYYKKNENEPLAMTLHKAARDAFRKFRF